MAENGPVGLDVIEIPQSSVRDYPGGYAKWHADISAKLTREGVCSKTPVLGGGNAQNDVEYGITTKNSRTGQISGKLNAPNVTEQRYRDAYLVPRILTGEIIECIFEGVTLILAGGGREWRCSYTPDWWVRRADGGHEAHEVKGAQVWDDSRVKFKVARELFPWVKFVWGQYKGGRWVVKAQTLRA